jgi:hypothetical protein
MYVKSKEYFEKKLSVTGRFFVHTLEDMTYLHSISMIVADRCLTKFLVFVVSKKMNNL